MDYHTLAKSGIFLEMLTKWLISASGVGHLLRNPRSATTINCYMCPHNYFERGTFATLRNTCKNARKDFNLKEKYHLRENYAKQAKCFEKKNIKTPPGLNYAHSGFS